MQNNAMHRDADGAASGVPVRIRQHRKASYQKVRDERKRPIRGLWVRNNRYYAQLTLEDSNTGEKQLRRVPLEKAATPAQARDLPEEIRVQRIRSAAS